nr:hypothetical protein GCM10017611_66270 [Rhodococcus wratislaviensis]
MDGDGYVGHHSPEFRWHTVECPDDHVLEPFAFDVDHASIVPPPPAGWEDIDHVLNGMEVS